MIWLLIAAIWLLDFWLLRAVLKTRAARRSQWQADHPNLKWDDWKHVVRWWP